MPYRAPVTDFQFLLDHVVGFQVVSDTPKFAETTPDVVAAIFGEAGRLSEEVLAPLRRNGDEQGAVLENGIVRTSPGYADGYRAMAEGGWVGISASPEYGGMGLPQTVGSVVNEMMSSACLSVHLTSLLSQGQIDALSHHASDEIRALYLPNLVSGEWSGTMNLTEPQAGSDVGGLRTKAIPNDDGTYAISGQKIFISWADNDFTGNVCHLVLARLPDGGAGTKGISLFMVPKFIPDSDGNPGKANTLRVASLEEKMGLHGSPTAVMEFDGATGWLVGERHAGMKAMFTMMNNARLGVGVQGVGQAEGAYQQALSFAMERQQGKTAGGEETIIGHADVRRMLATMKADIFAARTIVLACAVAIDMAEATGQDSWRARAEFLTPIAKAFGTDVGCEVAHLGVQLHGGMGYIEETGAAQYSRDVCVTTIYEGTNGIQAMDLVARKLADGGEAAYRILDEVETIAEAARADFPDIAAKVWTSAESLRETTEWLVQQSNLNNRFAGAVPFLRAFARVIGGAAHLKSAVVDGPDSGRARMARFYITRMLPEHVSLLEQVHQGGEDLMAITPEDLGA